MKIYPEFKSAISSIQEAFQHRSHFVHTEKWQGMDISERPEMGTYELLNMSFQVPLHTADLGAYRESVKPNLPWADDHFEERVGGRPLNPGVQWARWPYAKSADRFLARGVFTHTYMERYWPKQANMPVLNQREKALGVHHRGIRYAYGDLNDVVNLLVQQPLTRQAYLPVWFPEDTGAVHGGRLPCTLGYHFIMRNGYLHIVYYLRSCDFVRHFRDDIYLTVRLLVWMKEQLEKKDLFFKLGTYTMHITSFHLFKADWVPLFGAPREN